MSAQIKCHKCGKNHKAHTAQELWYIDGFYCVAAEKPTESAIRVYVGNTCFENIWKAQGKNWDYIPKTVSK